LILQKSISPISIYSHLDPLESGSKVDADTVTKSIGLTLELLRFQFSWSYPGYSDIFTN
jgi:hypothetical protein